MEDDYKTRMVEEFHELKDRINKINDIIEKYNNGQRGHITVREASLMMAQSYIMQDYALVLFDRLTVVGINPESDDVEPEEKPLPPEPQSHGLFIPRDGKPYLILHDENDTWSYVVNTPGVMCRIRTLTKPGSNKSLFSGYREWGDLVEALPDSAFPLIPLNASSMSTIAKALADSK